MVAALALLCISSHTHVTADTVEVPSGAAVGIPSFADDRVRRQALIEARTPPADVAAVADEYIELMSALKLQEEAVFGMGNRSGRAMLTAYSSRAMPKLDTVCRLPACLPACVVSCAPRRFLLMRWRFVFTSPGTACPSQCGVDRELSA